MFQAEFGVEIRKFHQQLSCNKKNADPVTAGKQESAHDCGFKILATPRPPENKHHKTQKVVVWVDVFPVLQEGYLSDMFKFQPLVSGVLN